MHGYIPRDYTYEWSVTHLSKTTLLCATSMTGPDALQGQCFIAPQANKPHFGRYTCTVNVLESRKTLGG